MNTNINRRSFLKGTIAAGAALAAPTALMANSEAITTKCTGWTAFDPHVDCFQSSGGYDIGVKVYHAGKTYIAKENTDGR